MQKIITLVFRNRCEKSDHNIGPYFSKYSRPLFQQRVRHLRGPVLEAGRVAVLHRRPPLAGPRVRSAPQPEAEAHGL
jgi:hypothetical protein